MSLTYMCNGYLYMHLAFQLKCIIATSKNMPKLASRMVVRWCFPHLLPLPAPCSIYMGVAMCIYIYIPLDTTKRKKLGSNLPKLRTNKWSLVFLVAWSHDVPCGAHGGCHQRSMEKNRGAGRYSHEIHHDTSFISPPVQSHDFQNLTVLIFPTQLSHQTQWYFFIEIL